MLFFCFFCFCFCFFVTNTRLISVRVVRENRVFHLTPTGDALLLLLGGSGLLAGRLGGRNGGLVDGELDGVDGRAGAEVVLTGLQSLLPGVEVHGRELRLGGGAQEQVQRLRLVDVDGASGGHVDQVLLLDLPDGAVERLDVVGDAGDLLHAAVVRDDLVARRLVPQTLLDQVAHEILVHDGELARQHAAQVDVRRERLEALVVAQDLARRRRRHRRHKERVAHAVRHNLLAERRPVVATRLRRRVPQVELELSVRHRATAVLAPGLELAVGLRKLHGPLARRVVDGLEDVLVQALCLVARERQAQQDEAVRHALDADADGAVALVRLLSLGHRVGVGVDDAVEVVRDHTRHLLQLLVVEELFAVVTGLDELGERDRGEVADGHLVLVRVLHDLRAQVAALDRAQVLLVGLRVARVLVQQVRRARLDLRLKHREPQGVRRHRLQRTALTLVPLVERLEVGAPDVGEPLGRVGVEEGPGAVGVHTLHEQVRDPQGVEQVTGTVLLLAGVLLELQEVEDVGVPRLEVDREGALALAATLVHVARRVVEHAQHGHQAVALSVRAADVRAVGTDVVHVHADTAGGLADEGARLQGVEDAVDGVVAHRDQEARRHLRARRARVEEGRRRVREPALREQVVGLDDAVDIREVDAEGDAHQHVLRTLADHTLAVALDLEQVRPLERLVAKVLVVEVTLVVDRSLDALDVGLGSLEGGLRHKRSLLAVARVDEVAQRLEGGKEVVGRGLVQGGDSEAAGQQGVVRVLARLVRGALREKLLDLG
eukprot:Rhum_TRINITY_DN10876_c0_g1::Rhum_TRINITY_DN10876_c0_g1_i1::g.40448::m.40448